MRRMVVMLVAGLLTAQAGAALAQYTEPTGKLEIIPMGGYRWGGSLNTVSLVRSIDTQDGPVYGIGLGVVTPKNSEAEIMWSHFQGDINVVLLDGTPVNKVATLKRDDILLNGLWYAYHPTAKTKPFFTAGLGAALFSSENTSTYGRFTWMLGVGLRRELSDRAAFRISGKWTPVWVTTGSGVWCDPFYCYSVGTGENYDQWEVSGALVIKP